MEEGHRQIPADEAAVGRQHDPDDHHCEGQGKADQQHGLSGQLPDELEAAGPDHLADADFPGAADASGRRQIHVVDARDKQDEKGDEGKKQDRPLVDGSPDPESELGT